MHKYLDMVSGQESFTYYMYNNLTASHFQLVFGQVILKWWGVEVKPCWHSKSCLFLQYNDTVKMYKFFSTFFPIKEGFHSCILELHLNSLL
jgi:hypothetical protein